MKQLMMCRVLLVLLLFTSVIPGSAASSPEADKAKQQELLTAVLKEYDSQNKVKALLGFLGDPDPEIKTTALKALQALPNYYKRQPMLDVLRAKSRGIREYAAEVLGTADTEELLTPLFNAVLNDPYEKVRQNALNSLLKLTPHEKLIIRFGDILKQEGCGPYHIRAAGTLGEIGQGSDQAIVYLVERLKIIRIWPPGPRVHILFGDQFTYIRDYDIVQAGGAQGQSAADPILDTVYAGICLDLRVTKVEEFMTIERGVICRALDNIADKQFGEDINHWIDWWATETGKTWAQRYREKKAEIERTGNIQKEDDSNIEKHLKLGIWCKNQKQEKEALQEFTAVLARDTANTPARANLKEMGYGLYQKQWQPLGKTLPMGEKATHNLLNYLKTYDDDERQEVLTKLGEIEPIYKLRPFIKTLQSDPIEYVRAYAAEGLGESKEPKAIPYLVKASLEDEVEDVRNKAFNSINKLGIKDSIIWYVYFLENNPGGTALMHAAKILGEIGTGDTLVIVALLRQMYRINLGNQAAPTLPELFPSNLQGLDGSQKEKLPVGPVIIELPDKQLTAIKTDEQFKTLGNALAKVTGQNYGTDYSLWINWWNKNHSKK